MKGRLRIASKKLSAIALSCLMLFTTVAPMMQTSAADSVKGLETNVDRTALDKAVADARNAGVPVTKGQDQDMGVAHSKSEVDAKIAEIKADYQQQIQKLEEAKKAIAKCDEEQKAYDAAKKKYDEELAKYNIAKQKYDEDMVIYNKAMEELEKRRQEDGYLSEPAAQLLTFKSEPNANMRFLNGKKFSQYEWQSYYHANIKSKLGRDETQCYNDFSYINRVTTAVETRTILQKNKPLKVEYTNLQNSYYNGKKISKVEYTYTLIDTGIPGLDVMPVLIEKDPTVTIWYLNFYGEGDINMVANFYDENGQKMDMTGALLSFSSLNNGLGTIYNAPSAVGKSMVEKVLSFNGEYIYITGSSIVPQLDGGAYASSDNEHKSNGSKFSVSQWDDTKVEGGKPTWYGAIVGKANGPDVRLDIGASKRGVVWFAFNSMIRALAVPNKPVEPVKPTPPKEPQCPPLDVSYHYDLLYYQPPVEKTVTDQNNADINNKTVPKNSVVKFTLNVADFPAGREKAESLVFNDTLPEGYAVDLAGTRQASPNYDISYDPTTRRMVFTAKADLLAQINSDLGKDSKVPAPIITGTVTKEETTYVNDFDLTINNTYTVKSKPVKVHTPSKPRKDVFTGTDTTSIDGKVVQPGQELRYELTYTNMTGTKQTVTFTDKIPQYTSFVSADNDGVNDNGTITWTKEVEDGQTVTVSFKVKVNDDVNGNPVDNQGHVKDGVNESDTNKTHNPTPTEPKKDVFTGTDTTSIDGKVVAPGQELRYELTYTNTTGSKQTVTFTDKIPEYTTFVAAENNGSYDAQSKVITWTQEVEAGKTATVSFKVKVNDDVNGNPVDNQGHVKDGVNESDTNKTHNPTPTEPKKDVFTGTDTTSIDGKVVQPGQELRYELTYTNTTGEKQTVTFTDKIPEYTTFVSAENNGSYDAQSKVITWTQEVEAGKTATVSFKVKVNDDVNGNPVDNQGHVKDGVNESDTNKTHNPTPTGPKKDVFTGTDTTSIDGKVVAPGQELRYELTYTNTTGTKQTVTFTDKIPEYTTFVSAENNGSYDAQSKVITWTQEVEAGKTATVSFKVKVNDDVNGNPVDNQGHVKDGVNESDTNKTHNPTPTEPKKDVFTGTDTTSIDGKVVQPGQELRYELTYTNTTGSKQTVTFTDKIPEYTTFVSAENNGSYDAQSKVITWTQEVEAGKTATVSFKVKVNDDVNGNPVDNQGHVKDGVNESDTNKTHNPTPTEPKKDVFTGTDTTSIDGKVVQPGQELRYELTYTNTTGSKQTVTFTDKIPQYTSFVSADNDGVNDNGTITWTREVENGATVTVSFKVKVNDDVNGNPVDNQGHVKDGVNESDTNKTHNPTPTEPKKDVFTGTDTTSIDGKVVQPGQELRYELTYTNTTGSKQTVTFTDKIPQYTSFVSADNDGVNDNGVVTWTKEVENGQTVTVSFKVKVNDDVNGNPVDNQGHVKDGVNESDTNKTHNPTPTEPKKDVFTGTDTTSIDGKVVAPGQELRYELTYTNTTGTKQTVTFTDKIPQYTSFVSADNDGVNDNGVVTWTREVENGATVTVSFKVKVNDDVNGNPVDNQGHVKDGVNESDTNKTHNPTPTEPKKDVFTGTDTTSIDGKVVQPGQELRYELTYTNTTGSKQTVTFTDKIPEYTTFVSAENNGSYDAQSKVITWTQEVEAGKTATVSFKVKVNDDVNGNPVDNQGHVKDGVNESDTNKTHNPTPTEPKKDVFTGTDTTSIDGKVVQPGQELRYELTYTNTTGEKQTVTFTDKIPQYTSFVSADNDGVNDNGTITWTKEVENGQTVTVSFKVKVNDDVNGNPVDNQGHVKDGVNESDTNKTHNPTPTEPKKDVFTGTDTTSIDGKVVQPGQELRYELTYTNTTGSKQTVTFTDKIPQYTSFVSADNDGVNDNGTITWTKEVENGATVTVSFKVKVNDDVNGNPVDNQGHVKDGVNESDTNKTHNPTPTEPKKDVFTGTDTTSIDGKVVQPGQELRYELTYTNTTGTKQTVTFTDKIPQYTTFVSAEDGGQESGGTITWTKEVENGATVTVSFKVKVNDDVNGNPVDNQGHVKDGVNESDTNKTHNPTPTEPKKDVFTGTDTTSIDGKVVAPGQELRYELTYTNTTGSKQTVTFTDKIPEYTTFVSAENSGSYDAQSKVITWTKEVENGATVTVSFKVKVNDDVNGNPVDNQGHVKDGVNESDTNKTHNPTPTEPKKDVFTGTDTTSIDGKVVQPGQELRYELTYTNTTGSKQTVTFTDKIPQYTSFVSADNDGVNDNGTITWTKEVENGATVTVSFKVKVNDDVNGNPVDNQGHVKDGVNESDTNKTHNPTPTEPKKDVFTGTDTTSIDGKVVQPGQELRYELTYTNTTGSKQTVTFTDKIPQYTTFVSAEDGGQESGGTITWTKEVENGATVTVSFKVKVNDDVNGNPVDNQGHVKDGVNESDTNKTHNPTPTEPKKDVFTGTDTTSIDGKVVQPGQELRYELTYTNTTGSKQTVTFTDKIPQYTTFVSAEDGGQESGGTITWTKEVENGATVTVSFKVKVNDDVNGNPVDNQGHVKDGVNESDTNKTHNPTPTEPKKDVFTGTDTTSIDGKVVQPGQELRYELTYTNTTGTKQTVTFTDKIPQYTTFVSAEDGGQESGGTITWTKEVENGATVTVSFKVKVNDDVNGNPVDNQGHVKDGVNESDTNKTHNPTPTEPKKDVFTGTDTTSIDGKVVASGQELRYELTYTNTTGSKQTVTFTDKIPQYTSFVSADNDGVNDNGTITWTKEVENGATVTVSFKVKVNDDVNGNPVDNQGHVKDGVNESDTNKTHNPTPTEPKKDVFTGTDTTSIDGKVVQPGQELRYELTYTNTTGSKQTVTFTDKIPQYTTFVSAEDGGQEAGGTITWTKEVENGQTVTVSFKVKVNDDVNGNPVDNQGHVKDGVNESDTNKTHNPTPTEPKKDVFTGTDTTSIDGKVVAPGQELRYELTYTNTTGSKQTVTFTDKIPQYTSFVSADNDGVNDNGTITWTKEVENGATVTVSFKVKVNDDVNGNPVDNQGHVKDGVNESDTNKTHNPTPHKPEEPENPTPHNPDKPGLEKPKTSDNGNIPLMMFLLLASSGLLAGTVVSKRKKQQ